MWGETFFTRKFHRASWSQHGMVVIKTARQDTRSPMRRCQSNLVDFISQQYFSIIQLKPTKPLRAACGCRLIPGRHMRFESHKKNPRITVSWSLGTTTGVCVRVGDPGSVSQCFVHGWEASEGSYPYCCTRDSNRLVRVQGQRREQ